MSEHEKAAIEENVAQLRSQLAISAAHLAARYNGPVYLTGSVLHNPTPRDIDVRIVVADPAFAARFGNRIIKFEPPFEKEGWVSGVDWNAEGPTQRWIDDIAKWTESLSLKTRQNMDLQVWPASHWRDDTYPHPIVLARPSPHWWFYNEHVPDPSQSTPDNSE